ncbi:pro-sigmaK processing inhibitor BofA family protein [Pectinatus sottacetonis]|uniref:pro-sigmaK processing inhibitor BofA family protein n=1 Tax=Pectinatus sottacetonis TaxID=1002795 RepID=UPI0018C60D84|nr:pro-sigmaK processing inhibitor BofA family protein [Pectinatus sottacetonis]
MLNANLIIAFCIGLLILCLITKVFSLSIKVLWKLIYNSIFGAVCLWLVNFVFGLAIPIKFVTALIAGILGIPGVLLVIIYYLIR